ncbi:MAG: glutamate--tRNA ligase [Elusimicrobia bacterium]|nr:glutamate--tRNA ligase [Elusimicrobiota bacterium]
MSTDPAAVRVRFAPSPTGFLHIGGARTALYNYLYAKKNGGVFILRIEDTDKDRSSLDSFLESITESLNWLGTTPDEGPVVTPREPGVIKDKGGFGPYLQSARQEKGIYKEALDRLVPSGGIYKCYCTPEDLKQRREEAVSKGLEPGYDGRCRDLTQKEKEEFESRGIKYAWRIKTPDEGVLSFDDMIRGKIEVEARMVSDFVIMKSDGMPTYNFACAVDDHLMKISHVIRGDDHISNTHKQMLIYGAMGVPAPEYAHLPQVHGTDGKKLSKRTGAVSVEEYRDMGYLPGALRNYLALIGWSTEDSQQIFKEDELVKKFDLSRCNTSSGIFDPQKLDWMNGKYIREEDPRNLAKMAFRWLNEAGLIDDTDNIPRVIDAIKLEQEKIESLKGIPELIDFLVKDDIKYDEKSVEKRLKKDGVKKVLEDVVGIFEKAPDFTVPGLEEAVRQYVEKEGLGAGRVFHPVRVAVSGRMKGPGLFEMLEFLGREKVLGRMKYAIDHLT